MHKHDVIIACDFKDRPTTMEFLKKFSGDERPFVKIGMELFYGEGPDIVREIRDRGHNIFLDLKLHDIPNTVQNAMRNIAKLGVQMTNLHAAGTIAMMEAAVEGLNEGSDGYRPLLIAVTQLTSTSEERMRKELLIDATVNETVAHYAKNALAAGLDGVVCSPLETRIVKDACGECFLTVTPGIRYPGSNDDQSRITTPEKAREIGSDYIVVGRPITAADDPIAVYRRVKKDFLGEE